MNSQKTYPVGYFTGDSLGFGNILPEKQEEYIEHLKAQGYYRFTDMNPTQIGFYNYVCEKWCQAYLCMGDGWDGERWIENGNGSSMGSFWYNPYQEQNEASLKFLEHYKNANK